MTLRGILGVALLVSRRGFRAWQAYLSSLLSTVWLLAIFYALGGSTFLPHAVVGAIISLVLSGSASSAVYEAYYSLIKLRDAFLASPLSALGFRVGVALGTLLPSLPTLLAYCALLPLVTSAAPLGLVASILVTVPLTWIMGVLLGYVVARGDLNASPKINLLNRILTLLPPIYYPSSVLPRWLRPLAHLAPTYNISELMKSQLGITPFNTTHIATCTAALALQLMLVMMLALRIRE